MRGSDEVNCRSGPVTPPSRQLASGYFGRTRVKDGENFLPRPGGGETLAHASDRSETFAIAASVRRCSLKLILRDDKENDKFHWRVVERIELNSLR